MAFAGAETLLKGVSPMPAIFMFSVHLLPSSERPLTPLAANHLPLAHHCSRVARRVHKHGDESGLEAQMQISSRLRLLMFDLQ